MPIVQILYNSLYCIPVMRILLSSVAPTSACLGVGSGAELVQEEDPWVSISVLDREFDAESIPPVTR